MRIVSWNVNGIKSTQSAIRLYLLEVQPDVLCLNELKVTEKTLGKVVANIMEEKVGEMYDAVWNPCTKGAWHGTAVLAKKCFRMNVLTQKLEIRSEPGNVSPWLSKNTLGLSYVETTNSHIIPGKRDVSIAEIRKAHQDEGRILAVTLTPLESDTFVLVATYVPNSGVNFKDPLRRLAYRVHHWDCDLFAYLLDLEKEFKGRVIWCGDLNVIHQRKDVSFFNRRVGCAGVTHDERASFDGFLSSTLFEDAFRLFCPFDINYSFYHAKHPVAGPVKHRGKTIDNGWRLDYFIVHSSLRDHLTICSIDIEDDSKFATRVGGCGTGASRMRVSDHLPISLSISF